MIFQGKIRNFAAYTPAMAEQMRTDLSLSMRTDQLLYCAGFYRTNEKRDPYIEELVMLDRLISELAISPATYAPNEFLTNHTPSAQTYADLLQKRKVLKPDASHPMTLAEIFETADAYLARVGKYSTLRQSYHLEEPSAQPFASDDRCVSAAPAGLRLHAAPKSAASPEEGDLLLLLLPRSNSYANRQGLALGEFLKSETARCLVKERFSVGKGGLLGTLLGITESAWIEPARLSVHGEPVALSLLADAYAGETLIRIAAKDYERIYRTAAEHGLFARVFASVTRGNRYTFADQSHSFSLPSDFIRSLFPILPVTATLADETEFPAHPISHTPLRGNRCAYLRQDRPLRQTESIEETLYAASCAEIRESLFQNTVRTLLAPILTLAAAGQDYTKLGLALGVALPTGTDSNTVGNALSLLLGIYRVQTELAIPTVAKSIAYEPALSSPKLTSFAVSEHATALPCQFTAQGNAVYCIAPDRSPDGTVDFASLRKLLSFVASLRQAGALQSARILCGESVTDGLRAMSTDSLSCFMIESLFAGEGPLPLAILLETTQSIIAKKVGTVFRRQTVHAAPKTPVYTLPESLIASERPHVVILAQKTDTAAKALASALSREGAEVFLPNEEADPDAHLSYALLNAQTLILCGKVALGQTERTRFALDTFLRAGGSTLLVGGAAATKIPSAIAFPNGIPDAVIAAICKKTE